MRITNARLALPEGLTTGTIEIHDGSITAVETGPGPGDRDLGGQILAPGFIDVHIHGGAGFDFMDATDEAFETILQFHAKRGVTGVAATSASSTLDELLLMLQETERFIGRKGKHAQVLGAHLEGPYLSPEMPGCHLPEYVRRPVEDEIDRILDHRDAILHWTLAPEIEGGIGLTKRIGKAGISASAGHTMAYQPEIREAKAEGLKHVTHLFSAMTSYKREGPWRIPGTLETTLGDDELTTEIICDGKHLPDSMMRFAWKSKGADRLCLVSDTMRGAGMPIGGEYTFGPKNGQKVVIDEGVAMLPDKSSFASSITPLDEMLRIAVNHVGIPAHEAIRMISLTPATVLGVESKKGSLEVGKDADFTLLDDDLQVLETWIGGERVV